MRVEDAITRFATERGRDDRRSSNSFPSPVLQNKANRTVRETLRRKRFDQPTTLVVGLLDTNSIRHPLAHSLDEKKGSYHALSQKSKQ